MKILQINKFFYIRGGASRYFFEVSKLLKSYGHEIAFFSMSDPKNEQSKWSDYFVSNISFENVKLRRFPRIFTRMFYSFESKRNLSRLLDSFKADVAHLHSIYHHISPSIILELKKRKIPIVQTLHDYHIISPNHTLFHDGEICEITKRKQFYKAVFHKCVKNSYSASFLDAIEQYLHDFMGIYKKNVDLFIAPSQFMADKLIDYGISKNKIILLYNFCNYKEFKPHYGNGEYILYFGRLSPEKGLDFMIEVMDRLPTKKLLIAGRGLIQNDLKDMVKVKGLRNVSFLGYKTGEELKELIYKSKFVVLPSLSYEIFPTSIMEAFVSGKPLLASRIGGIPELVKDGYNGFLFEAGDKNDCIEKINKLWNNPNACYRLGKNSREYMEKNHGPEDHYIKLLDVYKKATKNSYFE